MLASFSKKGVSIANVCLELTTWHCFSLNAVLGLIVFVLVSGKHMFQFELRLNFRRVCVCVWIGGIVGERIQVHFILRVYKHIDLRSAIESKVSLSFQVSLMSISQFKFLSQVSLNSSIL